MSARLACVRHNLAWFLRSGVMRPSDGFWGVAERLAVTTGNEAVETTLRHFPCHTRLSPDLVAVEHRRADCNFEVAYLFDLAAEALGEPALRNTADTLIDFLLARSHLRNRKEGDPNSGLWGWAMPITMNTFWTDDNAWVTILLLKLAARGRPELRLPGLQAGRALTRHLKAFFAIHGRNGRALPREAFAGIPMSGLMLNPHWIGLACMALAHAAAGEPELEADVRAIFEDYYAVVPEGPPPRDSRYNPPPGTGRAWTLSEYAYLALGAAVVARRFPGSPARTVALSAGETLEKAQFDDGHFPAEHEEAPSAPHLADLIYTDNWAVLAFHHLHGLTGDDRWRQRRDRSLAFLASIQDRDPSPFFNGCWRGMYDTRAGRWGGGDRFEGGANSLYSGWTNAPIAWSFLFSEGHGDLFTG